MKNTAIKDFIKEITRFIEDEGYRVFDVLVNDYGETIKLYVEKDNKKSVLPIVECFYDTDSKTNRVKWHGVFDIRMTPWYKRRKREMAF